MKPRWRYISLFLIVAVALLLRAIYLIEIRKSPFFLVPFGDGEYFDSWAVTIASGDVVGSEVFFKAPLYAYVLAFFYSLFGHHLLIPRLLNLFFDAASVILVFVIARKLWNHTAGLVAAALTACGGIFIYFSGEILGTSLAIMLGLAVMNLLLYEGKRLSRWLFSGVVLSLLVLVRPNGLLLLPAAMIFITLKQFTLAEKSKRIAVFLAGVLSLVIVTGVRNYAVGKDVVLVNYSGGVNFYIGNNEESDGVSAVLPGYGNDWDEYSIAEKAVGRELQASEVSRYWMAKGIRFIFSHPLRASVLMCKKCYLLFNGKEISNNQNIYRFAHTSSLLKWLLFLKGSRLLFLAFPSSFLIALGISGILLSLFSYRRTCLLGYLFLLFFGISVVLFFMSSRYRMPFIAFLVPFASFSICSLWSALRRKKGVKLWLVSFLPFLILCSFDPYGVSMENEALECYNIGNAHFKRGEYEEARTYYERGIKEDSRFPRLHLNLGAVHFKAGRYGDAEREYLFEIKVNPLDARAYHNLALLYEKEGLIGDALDRERDAVRLVPRFDEALRGLGRLYVKVAEYDSAIIPLERAYQLKKEDVQTISLLALAHLKAHHYDRSIYLYRVALESHGDDAFMEYNLAVALLGKGELEDARKHLVCAISLKQDFAEAHFNLGMVYLRLGDEERAKSHLIEALRLQPDMPEAKKMIEKME
jgi:tetratricopeptide (TPR) repeat protein